MASSGDASSGAAAASAASGKRAPLNRASFRRLDPSVSGAFLLLSDADRKTQARYGRLGLEDVHGHRRIAQVVRVPANTRLFKATQHREEWTRSPLSSWWSTVLPFRESRDGALDLVRIAKENGVHFRDLVRFISAVSLDWNRLDWYVEVVLREEVQAYWGQFAPQRSIQKSPPANATVTGQHDVAGVSQYVDHGDGKTVYLPDTLGGFGAWQLYIPDFDKHLIDPGRIINLSATDDRQLERHLSKH